ncbi:MAG: hypothetical protein J6S41_00545, partial [Clostridia bacterium]|nr:hypothetical protein [Clostridia bacterium]
MRKKSCRKFKLSPTSTMHFVKLYVRIALFLAVLALYIVHRVTGIETVFGGYYDMIPLLVIIIMAVYAVEMALRFFPARIESMGCQKQFRRNYRPTGEPRVRVISPLRTFVAACAWIALNSIFGVLYYLGVIDDGILVLISLFYGVCDMICILFFCPFQTWFLKNRCCTDCRIYNWDFAMMFTPLVFINSIYTHVLVILSVLLLLRWEITLRLHPERFTSQTNASLRCENCEEKLCRHKRQLQGFIRKNKE